MNRIINNYIIQRVVVKKVDDYTVPIRPKSLPNEMSYLLQINGQTTDQP